MEVLRNDVQKYSLTSVSGGGGYVTTVNGTTFGQTREVISTVEHHVDQNIWVKDLSSGKEMQLNFKEFSFPVRPGHILVLAKDEASEEWERLINKTTGEKSYANEILNPIHANHRKSHSKRATFIAVGLLVPFVNFLVGLYALMFVLTAIPVKIGHVNIPGAPIKILLALLTGFALFLASFVAFTKILSIFIGKDTNMPFIIEYGSLGVIIFCFPLIRKMTGTLILESAKLISKKSDLMDKEVAQFRAKFS